MTFFITGMPGTGKRGLAHKLASVFEITCIDMPGKIAAFGETTPQFRKHEAELLAGLFADESGVVVTGCYCPLDERNRNVLKTGKVIYLYTDPSQLWEEMPITTRQSNGFDSIDMLTGICEEISDIYLKTADFVCRNDQGGFSAYNAARDFVKLMGII